MTSTTNPSRRPYHGSCHCGFIRYVLYMVLPPPQLQGSTRGTVKVLRARKCNCSTCHKMAFFHLRVPDAPNDFMLLSPPDPYKDLGDYLCFEKNLHWLFCPKCAVRCFTLMGEGKVVEKEVPVGGRADLAGEHGGANASAGSGVQKVWIPEPEGWIEGIGKCYLSVNAHTLEPRQEGLDLRELAEKKLICYLDALDDVEEDRFERPHVGGTY